MNDAAGNITCLNVANYFLSLADEEAGDLISNMKLQKLVYYAQGFHLAMFDKPLFAEPVAAWTHGPVIPLLYQKFKEFGSGPIPRPERVLADRFPKELCDFLNEVYNEYGQYDAWKLRNLTHEEPPWRETYNREPGGCIPLDAMKDYFKTQLQ
ncbi:MAG: SocA family protein [Magnetococcales bacterium]|nr:SocA family protein [Magnetococcales bacterium]MBF0321829.1 SocA family protein [Magnetococcales bacterium]